MAVREVEGKRWSSVESHRGITIMYIPRYRDESWLATLFASFRWTRLFRFAECDCFLSLDAIVSFCGTRLFRFAGRDRFVLLNASFRWTRSFRFAERDRFVLLNAIVSFRWTRSFRFAERDRFLSPLIVSLEIFRFLILFLILVLTLAGKYYMKGKKMKTFTPAPWLQIPIKWWWWWWWVDSLTEEMGVWHNVLFY